MNHFTISCCAALCIGASFANAADIHMAGDSTMCNYPAKRAPRAGWGQVLASFCKPGVKVDNRAISGFSSKSFIDRGKWDNLLAKVAPGDFVIIQFGHNDQKSKDPKRYAAVDGAYPDNLKRFITDVRAKKGNPVLATSISRRTFKKGKLVDPAGLRQYAEAAIAVANELNVPVVDLNILTKNEFDRLGPDKSLALFMASQPATSKDNTHTNFDGAKTIAGMFVDDVKKRKLPIAELFN